MKAWWYARHSNKVQTFVEWAIILMLLRCPGGCEKSIHHWIFSVSGQSITLPLSIYRSTNLQIFWKQFLKYWNIDPNMCISPLPLLPIFLESWLTTHHQPQASAYARPLPYLKPNFQTSLFLTALRTYTSHLHQQRTHPLAARPTIYSKSPVKHATFGTRRGTVSPFKLPLIRVSLQSRLQPSAKHPRTTRSSRFASSSARASALSAPPLHFHSLTHIKYHQIKKNRYHLISFNYLSHSYKRPIVIYTWRVSLPTPKL